MTPTEQVLAAIGRLVWVVAWIAVAVVLHVPTPITGIGVLWGSVWLIRRMVSQDPGKRRPG